MGKLNGKVAVITAATSGMALATAKLFVEEGAYVFITGRRQDKLDEAVKLIGKNVTGVTTALSFSMAPSPASRVFRRSASTAPARLRFARSLAPGS
jgi:NADP-dependent 3-hydroxy acid dehydrogenase YdfG